MNRSYGDLFTGFGGATSGALAAGYTPLWGVELRPDVAEVANANLGGHVRVADILGCKPSDFERVDHLHASPPCPNFSVAKAGAVETVLDISLAKKVADFVRVLRPETFTLENVYGYRKSRSWAIVEDALHRAGYWVNVEHINAANFGVPQTRKRMIVRAVRGGFVPYLPEPVAWVGWYAAIEDLLDTLPESQFAPWQLARLPESIVGSFCVDGTEQRSETLRTAEEPIQTIKATVHKGVPRAFLMTVQGEASDYLTAEQPSQTIGTSHGAGKYRAFLVDGKLSNSGEKLQIVAPDEPSRTVVSSMSAVKDARAWLSRGRVVAMTPRALERFQSLPDRYELPEKRTLAAYGIGNACPPLMMQRILEGLP